MPRVFHKFTHASDRSVRIVACAMNYIAATRRHGFREGRLDELARFYRVTTQEVAYKTSTEWRT